jgi:amyloid beta precursor protein binding protein 1
MATNDKYDRQLRLWGANGQRKLMHSNILLIKADSVGTEALKNLVLPGIGSFTILDDFIVDQSDLGCNFFTTASSVGKPRAEVLYAHIFQFFSLFL